MKPTKSAAWTAPKGTCDSHVHIYGPQDQYPTVRGVSLLADFGRLSAYQAVMGCLGIERAVIVQPSAYGTDNRCLLDAMKLLGNASRGVVVVDDSITDDALADLDRQGVRGIRFLMLPGGVLPWDILETMAARAHDLGWHIQLQMDGRHLHERETLLKRLPSTLVIDHTGKFLEPVDTDHPGYRALLRLLESGRTWVKLSAPYETSKDGPPFYPDVGRLARGLIAAAPERMLWAANWPHPGAQASPPDDAALLDVLRHWAGEDSLIYRILVDNPAALYQF